MVSNNPDGVPSKYTPEMLEKAKNYLANFKQIGDEVPSVEGLSVYLKVVRKTIYNWSKVKKNSELLHTLEMIKAKQAQRLINKGLIGDFNSNIVKLMLGNHGYHDKQDLKAKGGLTILMSKDDVSHG